MDDQSALDRKYFLDETVFNCPFCNRRNVAYDLLECRAFNWSKEKSAFVYFVECKSCDKTSMHLSYEYLVDDRHAPSWGGRIFKDDIDLDEHIFYSVPTSFFIIDSRIPQILRELITEAEGCLKMNYLTGASACMRKAIYELLVLEKASGDNYEERIKSLKETHKESDPSLFDVLGQIQDMTSDKIHEQSWDKWDSRYLKLIIETLKTVLHDIYVIPEVKKERYESIQKLQQSVIESRKEKKAKTPDTDNPSSK